MRARPSCLAALVPFELVFLHTEPTKRLVQSYVDAIHTLLFARLGDFALAR